MLTPTRPSVQPVALVLRALGLSQRAVAAELGITERYLSDVMVGRRRASGQLRQGLAHLLDVDAADLFDR